MLLFLMSCGASPQDIKPDEESKYVDLYLADGVRACGGFLQSYDRFIERSFELWAERDPGDFRVRVVVDPGEGCNGANGCANVGRARIIKADAQYHELAHTVTLATDGLSPAPLIEGVAASFGEVLALAATPEALQNVDMASFFSERPGPTLQLGIGGPYLRFLLESYGSESVRDFYRKMHEVADPDVVDFSREFEPIFGEPLEQSWNRFASEPRCNFGLWYCDMTEPVDLPITVDAVDCDDEASLSVSDDPLLFGGTYRAWRLVQLADEGAVDLIARYANVEVRLLWCGECDQQGAPDYWLGGSLFPKERALSLPPGTKVFRISHIDPTAPMLFELRDAGQ